MQSKKSSKYVKSISSHHKLLSTCNMQEFAKILIIFIFTDVPDQIVLTAVVRKRLKIKLGKRSQKLPNHQSMYINID